MTLGKLKIILIFLNNARGFDKRRVLTAQWPCMKAK